MVGCVLLEYRCRTLLKLLHKIGCPNLDHTLFCKQASEASSPSFRHSDPRSTHVINVRLAKPITSPICQRTGFSKSRGCLQAFPSFPSPTPITLFWLSLHLPRRQNIEIPFPNPTEVLATQAKLKVPTESVNI